VAPLTKCKPFADGRNPAGPGEAGEFIAYSTLAAKRSTDMVPAA